MANIDQRRAAAVWRSTVKAWLRCQGPMLAQTNKATKMCHPFFPKNGLRIRFSLQSGVRALIEIAVMLTVCMQFVGCGDSLWERSLAGPFYGVPCSANIHGEVTSALQIARELTLEVVKAKDQRNPVLRLRTSGGETMWANILLPVRKGDPTDKCQIERLRLKTLAHSKDGYKVRFNCYWTCGGDEDGILYLTPQHTLQKFAISW